MVYFLAQSFDFHRFCFHLTNQVLRFALLKIAHFHITAPNKETYTASYGPLPLLIRLLKSVLQVLPKWNLISNQNKRGLGVSCDPKKYLEVKLCQKKCIAFFS